LFFSFAVLTFFLFLPLLAFAGQFKVSRVYDGDTIQVIENEKEIIIHLVGIDAPELSHRKHLPGQPFCIKSKEYLSSLILNKVVHIKFFGKDGSEKLLGEIFTDQKNINIEMIKAGLAEVHRGMPAKDLEITAYRDAENKAKAAVKGIWELRDQLGIRYWGLDIRYRGLGIGQKLEGWLCPDKYWVFKLVFLDNRKRLKYQDINKRMINHG
jgi:endonuclease YncB( thermonuclease family)